MLPNQGSLGKGSQREINIITDIVSSADFGNLLHIGVHASEVRTGFLYFSLVLSL